MIQLLSMIQPTFMHEWVSLVIMAVLVSSLVGIYATPIGNFLKIIDSPDSEERKKHLKPTPLVGGLAVMLPTLLTGFFLYLNSGNTILGAVSILCAGMLALGIMDDRSHIAPLNRLIYSVVICSGALFLLPELALRELTFSLSDTPIVLGWTGIVFTVVCLVGLQNAINMADGKNGLVIGMTLIWTGLTAIYTPPSFIPFLTVFAAALAVAFIFNWRGKLFLGDGGAYSLSAVSGTSAICTFIVSPALSADMIILWFIVPVLDCLRLIWSRKKRGVSPFSADREHLHHYLGDMLPWHAGIVAYLSLVAIPAIIAVIFPQLTVFILATVVAIYFGVLHVAHKRPVNIVSAD